MLMYLDFTNGQSQMPRNDVVLLQKFIYMLYNINVYPTLLHNVVNSVFLRHFQYLHVFCAALKALTKRGFPRNEQAISLTSYTRTCTPWIKETVNCTFSQTVICFKVPIYGWQIKLFYILLKWYYKLLFTPHRGTFKSHFTLLRI